METMILENQTPDGRKLQATFLPQQGMNLCSYKLDDIEVMAQCTRASFESRFAGMGALIGPHFHRRNPAIQPKIEQEQRFPHIARARAEGVEDPFSHGIARYAPWQASQMDHTFSSSLKGKDEWEGVPLSQLQGQDFQYTFKGKLKPDGLHLELTLVSDCDSLLGLHYYYALPSRKATVTSDVQRQYREGTELHPLKENWQVDSQQNLTFDLQEEADYGFRPYKDPCEAAIALKTEQYTLHTRYSCTCAENSWQLYSPKDSGFVCIEPMSAKNPRKPQLTVSSLKVHLAITPS